MTEPTTVHRIVDTERAEIVSELHHHQQRLQATLATLVTLLHTHDALLEAVGHEAEPIATIADTAESVGIIADRLANADQHTETILRHEGHR